MLVSDRVGTGIQTSSDFCTYPPCSGREASSTFLKLRKTCGYLRVRKWQGGVLLFDGTSEKVRMDLDAGRQVALTQILVARAEQV